MKQIAYNLFLTAALAAGLSTTPALAKSYDVGTQSDAEYEAAQILSKPAPAIPPDLHDHCFKSCCIARFMINADGSAKVKLLTSSGLDEIDDITLSTLRRWKFKPAMLDGKPVPSSRRVKVEFEID